MWKCGLISNSVAKSTMKAWGPRSIFLLSPRSRVVECPSVRLWSIRQPVPGAATARATPTSCSFSGAVPDGPRHDSLWAILPRGDGWTDLVVDNPLEQVPVRVARVEVHGVLATRSAAGHRARPVDDFDPRCSQHLLAPL